MILFILGNFVIFGVFFWGFLIFYGLIMYILSPKVVSVESFFKASDGKNGVNGFLLISSIFISWIFAKSITNAANLGATYGIVGAFAYALYWLGIIVAGAVFYRLRVKFAATSLIGFLNSNFGKFASVSFSVAILIRLYNEIWSNTAVVGGYYGENGSFEFIIAAFIFTFATLIYSLKGGLKGSILTDTAQAFVLVVGVIWVIYIVLPKYNLEQIVSTGEWSFKGGVDLLLVGLLQIFSYPFHDPILSDRAFICREKTMLFSFIVAGVLGFFAILLFGFIGVYASLEQIFSSNIPSSIAKSLGVGAFFMMNAIMITAAGSSLDSAFASVSKLVGYDFLKIFLPKFLPNALKIGIFTMIFFAIFGNLPMIFGTDILKATTISGTFVIGLAPIFLLHGIFRVTKLSFHLSFWTSIICGIVDVLGLMPEFIAIGNGDFAKLLGVNFYTLLLCIFLYIAGSFKGLK